MTNAKRGPGRPKVAGENGTAVRVDGELLTLAEKVSEGMGAVITGMRPSRAEVIRSALRRGLEVMQAEIDAKR